VKVTFSKDAIVTYTSQIGLAAVLLLMTCNELKSVVTFWADCYTGFGLVIGFIETLYTPPGTTGSYNAIADLYASQFTVTHAHTPGFSVFTSRILATVCNRGIIPSHMKLSLRSLISFLPFLLTHLRLPSQRGSEFYVKTDGQSASLSWNKAPICGLRPDFNYAQTVAFLLMWGALSDERTCLSLSQETASVLVI
jgi:hypothetical protein